MHECISIHPYKCKLYCWILNKCFSKSLFNFYFATIFVAANGVMWRWRRRFDSTADQTRQNTALTLTHTHLTNWLGSGRRPKEISWGTFEKVCKTSFYMWMRVDRLTPLSEEVGVEVGRKHLKGRVVETRSEKLCVNGVEKGAEGCCLKELESREGGAVCLFQCLAQLGLVRLQASLGEPSLLPGRCQLPVVV